MKARLQFEDVFLPNGQQMYVFPNAASRFQPDISSATLVNPAGNGSNLIDADSSITLENRNGVEMTATELGNITIKISAQNATDAVSSVTLGAGGPLPETRK